MKKYFLSFSIIISAVIFSFVITNTTAAQNSTSSDDFSNLTYPITELGGCKDRNACKIYCDNSANTAACINYAEQKNLLSQEDLKVAKSFIAGGSKGPGSCTGKKECQAYCEDKNHIDECVSYAEDKGLMSGQELQKAKKVQAAIKKGVKFPSCNTKKECDAYCEDSGHMEECITFAQEAGLLSNEELQNTQKVLTAVKQGVKPPACKGKDACDIYCAEVSHADECVNFAVAAGIVTGDEARIIKETGGKGPGGCKNKSECNSYCSNDANRESCMAFATAHNIPQPQQPGQPGQGGGSGPNQSQGFNPGSGQGGSGQNNPNPVKCIEDCENVGNTCISQVDNGQKQVCEDNNRNCNENCNKNVCQDVDGVPRSVTACNSCFTQCVASGMPCWNNAVAIDSACRTTKDQCVTACQKSSKPTKSTQPGQPPQQPGQPGQPPQQPSQPNQPPQSPGQLGQNQPTLSQTGPGGCKTVEECQVYCQSHPEAKAECQQFKQSQKQGQSGQNQPTQGLNNQKPAPPTQPTPPQQPSPPSGPN